MLSTKLGGRYLRSHCMFSQTIEYALRAMVHLAAEPTGSASTKEVAKQAGVPGA